MLLDLLSLVAREITSIVGELIRRPIYSKCANRQQTTPRELRKCSSSVLFDVSYTLYGAEVREVFTAQRV